MGAKTSEAMLKAKRLITELGYSQAEAAKKAGVTAGGISQTAWWKAWKEKQNAANQGN